MFSVQIPHEETVGLLFPRGFTGKKEQEQDTKSARGREVSGYLTAEAGSLG